ncbi:MAG: SDR family oxidoreductase [Spirochaetaceae bacterium]|jgi:NAD(P)-dependent dehydrogenase (short-subunit alcohol dehydrogenase family)|nr:SDR family oxidoreductase [Spirochaetaceae bacterium]
MEKIFAGKTALVTGGTGGIGKAMALRLGVRGARVFVQGGSSPERLEGTLKAIRDAGGEAEGFLYDAGLPESAAGILDRVPRPDILICAWGPYKRAPVEQLLAHDWLFLTAANLTLPGILISSVLGNMIGKKWGRILLFGGTNTDAIRGFATTAAYSAAKTALGVVAKSVALTAGPYGVSCNVVCPGLTDTEYTGKAARDYNRERSPGGIPLNSGEIADMAIQILEHPQVNGAIIPIDRGLKL